jgi:hypothetical protein
MISAGLMTRDRLIGFDLNMIFVRLLCERFRGSKVAGAVDTIGIRTRGREAGNHASGPFSLLSFMAARARASYLP